MVTVPTEQTGNKQVLKQAVVSPKNIPVKTKTNNEVWLIRNTGNNGSHQSKQEPGF
jgi:hypothetical protein